MPTLNGPRTQHRMAELGYATAKRLAEAVPDIPYGSLRNAVTGGDPINLQRVYDIARALTRPGEELRDVVADILTTNDGVPDEPPKQPKRPAAPPPRRTKDKTGPKRAQAGSPA